MITWFQVGLTSGSDGNYLSTWRAFSFYTGGSEKDYADFVAGRIADTEINYVGRTRQD